MKGKPNQRRRGGPRQFAARMVDAMQGGAKSTLELSQRLGVSQQEVCEWAARPKNREYVAALLRVADINSQVLASTYKATVVNLLMGIAQDTAKPDPARKACVELLRMSNAPGGAGGTNRTALRDSADRGTGSGSSRGSQGGDAAGVKPASARATARLALAMERLAQASMPADSRPSGAPSGPSIGRPTAPT